MTYPELTVEKVIATFEVTGWTDTMFVCPDGTQVEITPCGYGEIKSVSDVDYWLVEDCMLPWLGGDKLENVVADLNRHGELVEKSKAEKAQLREFFDKGEANGWTDEDWSTYSDWHKDLYGFRPHGHVCGVYVRPY